jgi:hypothetical protein
MSTHVNHNNIDGYVKYITKSHKNNTQCTSPMAAFILELRKAVHCKTIQKEKKKNNLSEKLALC